MPDRPPTRDELVLLALLADGLTDEAVAAQLRVTERSVRRRLRSAMDKLGAVSRFQAGVLAERAGWLHAARRGDSTRRVEG